MTKVSLNMSKPSSEQLKILRRWRISSFWVVLVGYIGYYLCRGNISAALPLLSQHFSYSNSQLGVILTFSELAYAFGKLINGPLADKMGGKKQGGNQEKHAEKRNMVRDD